MTEEQKRFKILKRTSYEEQISHENKITTLKTISLGLSAAASLIAAAGVVQHTYLETKLIDIALLILTTCTNAHILKGLMKSISRKTMLQGKVEDINTELEIPEEEKCKVLK